MEEDGCDVFNRECCSGGAHAMSEGVHTVCTPLSNSEKISAGWEMVEHADRDVKGRCMETVGEMDAHAHGSSVEEKNLLCMGQDKFECIGVFNNAVVEEFLGLNEVLSTRTCKVVHVVDGSSTPVHFDDQCSDEMIVEIHGKKWSSKSTRPTHLGLFEHDRPSYCAGDRELNLCVSSSSSPPGFGPCMDYSMRLD